MQSQKARGHPGVQKACPAWGGKKKVRRVLWLLKPADVQAPRRLVAITTRLPILPQIEILSSAMDSVEGLGMEAMYEVAFLLPFFAAGICEAGTIFVSHGPDGLLRVLTNDSVRLGTESRMGIICR